MPEFSAALCEGALRGIDEKLGVDPVILDVRGLIDAFDAMVICHGRNDRQVRAIAEEIERQIDVAESVKPLRVEGWASAEWIALDYGDVVVHVFDEPVLEYYDLEHLWRGARAERPLPKV